jgi:hypothetical protein
MHWAKLGKTVAHPLGLVERFALLFPLTTAGING